jgi:tetratricopeptide (TPR) repeat protein
LSIEVDTVKEFGRRLREARQRAGLRQQDLAFPGCSPAYVSRLEAGQRTPSRPVLLALAERLAVSEEYLATGNPPPLDENQTLLDADIALRLDETELAGRLFREALGNAVSEAERARALAGLGQLAYRAGDARGAVRHLEESLAAAGADVADEPAVADTLGRAYSLLGQLDRGAEIFRRCLAAAEERDDRIETIRFAVLLTFALEDKGAFDEAAELLARTAPLVEESQDPLLRARIFWSRSRLHTLQNEPREAARYARKALEILELTEHTYYTGRAHQLLAHIELDRDRPEEALALLRKGWPLIAEASSTLEQAQFRLEEARALAGLGRSEEAAGLAMEVAAAIKDSDPGDAARAYTVLGDVFRDLGERERARELYELAVELFAGHPSRYLAEAYSRLAELLEEDGRKDDAIELLKAALQVRYESRGEAATGPLAPAGPDKGGHEWS